MKPDVDCVWGLRCVAIVVKCSPPIYYSACVQWVQGKDRTTSSMSGFAIPFEVAILVERFSITLEATRFRSLAAHVLLARFRDLWISSLSAQVAPDVLCKVETTPASVQDEFNQLQVVVYPTMVERDVNVTILSLAGRDGPKNGCVVVKTHEYILGMLDFAAMVFQNGNCSELRFERCSNYAPAISQEEGR